MTVDLSRRTHGRIATYIAGCRCAECREAKRLYSHTNAKQRANRRARHRAQGRAVRWVIENRPDVWKVLLQQAIDEQVNA